MTELHLAQVNLARRRAALDAPIVADFVARLAEINALADRSPKEAKRRLAHLDERGPTLFAFTFSKPLPPDAAFARAIDWPSFAPCPAM